MFRVLGGAGIDLFELSYLVHGSPRKIEDYLPAFVRKVLE